jgi:hypothetical protein
VRIFDAADKEVPYLVEAATEPRMHTVRTTCENRVTALDERADGLDVIVRLDAKAPAADGLSIVTPLTNFERRVQVFGSDDGATWKPLVDNGRVFDYSRYMDVSNREVHLPKNSYRQLKVSIAGIADERESPLLDLTRRYRGGGEVERSEKTLLERRPFRMDRIDLWHESREKLSERQRKAGYKVADWKAEEDAVGKTTIVHITMRREPLTELSLSSSSHNFSRATEVQVPLKHGVRTEWVAIGRGRVSLVDFGGYHRESLSLEFPEQRATEYRIVIHNEDNPPLAITGVAARGNVYRAVFLAGKDQQYRLAYGSDEAEEPRYETAAVLAALRPGETPNEGQLGGQVANPVVAGGGSLLSLRGLLNNAAFLGVVVVALVALLGWVLFRAARHIDAIPK